MMFPLFRPRQAIQSLTEKITLEDFIQKTDEGSEKNIDDDEAGGQFQPLNSICRHLIP
jgi:hypothetical protein